MTRLVLSPRAAADLEDIGDHIASDNPAAAIRTVERLEIISNMLRDHPRLGVMRSDIADEVRVFAVGSYLILFRSLEDGVEIVRYVHGARHLKGLA